MASTHKHIRSSTADKRPTTAIAEGQIALNTNSASPGLFFKDSTGATIIKVGPVHVGSTAPNATPAAGGSSGNSTGEVWLDNSLTPAGVKIWDGSAWVNATPAGSTTVQGLLELATNAETQAGSDTDRAVTPAGLQSKVSNSTSTTSSTTIASSTAVKSAYDLANAALPASGGTVTGELLIGNTGSFVFEGSTDNAFETTLAVTDPTADRTITFPDRTGTVITNADTGTVTSTMIADGTIVNADINASAAIALSKLATGALPTGITVASANIVDGTIVNADVNASAAIAGTKISPNFGSQNVTTTGTATAAALIPSGSSVPANGVYLPSANNVAISTNGTGRLFVDASGNVGIGTTSPATNLHVAAATPIITLEDTSGATADIESTCFVKNNDVFELQLRNAANAYKATACRVEFDTSGVVNHQWRIGNTERLRITSDGKLGLGTSSPQGTLNVQGGGTSPSLTYDTNDIANFDAGGVQFAVGINSSSPFGAFLQARDNTNGARIISLNPAGGNVGIGTTSPAVKLQVSASSAGEVEVARFRIEGQTNNPMLRVLSDEANQTITLDASGSVAGTELVFKEGGSEAARIDSAGRLLVGTSSQSGGSLLQVNDNRIRIATAKTPASATDTGVAGEICWDANYVYVCTATNTWKRTAISTW